MLYIFIYTRKNWSCLLYLLWLYNGKLWSVAAAFPRRLFNALCTEFAILPACWQIFIFSYDAQDAVQRDIFARAVWDIFVDVL